MQQKSAATGARIEGLDLARSLALFGMVIVNFHIVMVSSAPGLDAGFLLAEALQGRAAALFVVLAGVGLGLAGARHPWAIMTALTLKRALFLLVLGLLNSLIFQADILHYYAFYFVFGLVFLHTPVWIIVLAILGLILDFLWMSFLFDYNAGWDWETLTYTDFWSVGGFFTNLFFNGWHPIIPWLAFFLFGIALSQLTLTRRSTQIWLATMGISVFALVSVSSYYLVGLIGVMNRNAAIFFTADPIPPMPFFILAGGSFACAVIGLCLFLENPLKKLKLLGLFTSTGRQTLSLYIAHILIGMTALNELGLFGTMDETETLVPSLIFCAIAMVYAYIWSKFFKRGPLETLMRKMTG